MTTSHRWRLDRDTYTIHFHDGLAEVLFTMPMKVNRGLDALLDACSLFASESGPKRVLFDLRDASVVVAGDEAPGFAEHAAAFGLAPTDRFAVLAYASQPDADEIGGGLQRLGFRARVFRDQQDAFGWLREG